jgi:hypothetical protein
MKTVAKDGTQVDGNDRRRAAPAVDAARLQIFGPEAAVLVRPIIDLAFIQSGIREEEFLPSRP